jgi:hypothetical protein
MHMTVRAAAMITFLAKLGLCRASPKPIPAENSDVLNQNASKVKMSCSQQWFSEPKGHRIE